MLTRSWFRLALCLVWLTGGWLDSAFAQTPSEKETRDALHRAVNFFRENCSAGGGYIFRLSADLLKREGEGKVGPTTAWLEPPATPAVGMAYLDAYRICREPLLLEAAIETANALIQGQLVSGGWTEQIEFAPEDRKVFAYRVDLKGRDPKKLDNATTFDDDKSQSAVRFLMQLDKELEFKNSKIHEASLYALDAFVKSQYAIGAWPQRYREFPDPSESPTLQATFPESWSREYPKRGYSHYYTLNDNTISDMIVTMLDAWDVYGDPKYRDSARKGGEFLLLAQLPEPQPGWSQQYTREMKPDWARKFEPPAITGGESQSVMKTLLLLYRRTGDKKYLEPLPRAMAYYKKLALPNGQLARFYEIGTDKPLYFTRDYKLTYSDDDMPTHYGFKVSNKLDRLEREYQKVLDTPREKLWNPKPSGVPQRSSSLEKEARKLIDALDKRGAWVEKGSMNYHMDDDTTEVIESQTFSRNLVTLATYLGTFREE